MSLRDFMIARRGCRQRSPTVGPEERLPIRARLNSRGRLSPHKPSPSLHNLDALWSGFSFLHFYLSTISALDLKTLGVITPTTGASLELFEVAYLKRPGFRMSQVSLTHGGRLRGPRVSLGLA